MASIENESRLDGQQLEGLARQMHCDTEVIEKLYGKSARFREICEDYESCNQALERLQELERPDEAQLRDYTEMRGQLELELRACLGKVAERSD